MRKKFNDVMSKSVKDLHNEVASIDQEITKHIIDAVSNPKKDSNFIAKHRRQIAVIMTAIQQKGLEIVSKK